MVHDIAADYQAALAAFQSGDMAGASRAAETLLRQTPDHADALHLCGLIAFRQNAASLAADYLARAVAVRPDAPDFHLNHAAILQALGRLDAAAKAAQAAIALRPSAKAWNNLGAILQQQGKLADAAQAYAEVTQRQPGKPRGWINLGNMHFARGRMAQAAEAYRAALQAEPGNLDALNNLGSALLALEDTVSAEAAFRAVLAIQPAHAAAHSNLLFCINYRTDLDAAAIRAEYRQWDERHGRHGMAPHGNARNTDRRLKIGYVSPDFRHHAVAMFFEPLLVSRDREAFEVYLYGEVANPDATTQRLRGLADHWRGTVGKSADEVAAQIRADGIDILVDLAGHTAGNRLPVFARKPAPVQFAYLIGQGTTTGLSAIDGFFTDDYMVPPGHEWVLSEQAVRLGRLPLVYRPPDGMPDVGELPAKRNGYVTFGSFSRTVRLNEKVIALWSELLKRVPNAVLVLNSKPFAEAASRQQFEARFAANGIDAERLKLIYTSPQPNTWAYYNEIDIALDPFPHNAGTTTIEALWMGVPVISKADRPTVGRFGASILGALDMSDWVAETPEQYVEIAARWAGDLDGLADLRSKLRPRFQASALSDGPGLVKAIEAGYRTLWQEWCTQPPAVPDAMLRQALLDAQGNQPAPALALCQRILEQQPDHAEALRLAALCADKMGQAETAAAYFAGALPHYPRKLNLAMSFANLLQRLDRWAEAEALYRARLQDNDPLVSLNFSAMLIQEGRIHEAEAICRQALAADPDHKHATGIHSNLLFCINYRTDLDATAIRAEYRHWDERHGRHGMAPHGNARNTDRRLKIGYVSPDFRHHAVAMFFEPLLVSRDREAFEVYLYGEVANPDATTQRLRGLADHWRGTVGKSDDEVAAQIRADGIDILVDLAGHTAGNRLPVFARKPAPVQFAYLIGQGTTTGLSAIDGFFTDDYMVPPGHEWVLSEQAVRLGRSPLVYRPPDGMPDVGELPAKRNGHVTFGSFSRTVRLNEKVIALWSALLKHVENSRLVLNNRPFGDPAAREAFAAHFIAHGVPRDRLHLLCTPPRRDTWAYYNEIDIALDPFPHNAGTTTIEALWMGVPVISKADRPTVGRFGASILGALDMSDWVAEKDADYIAIAARWAHDLDGLAALRQNLRPRFQASELFDGQGLVKAIEAGYRKLWQEWCRQ